MLHLFGKLYTASVHDLKVLLPCSKNPKVTGLRLRSLNPFGSKSWQHLLKPESTTWLGEIQRVTSCLCCGHSRLGISDVNKACLSMKQQKISEIWDVEAANSDLWARASKSWPYWLLASHSGQVDPHDGHVIAIEGALSLFEPKRFSHVSTRKKRAAVQKPEKLARKN